MNAQVSNLQGFSQRLVEATEDEVAEAAVDLLSTSLGDKHVQRVCRKKFKDDEAGVATEVDAMAVGDTKVLVAEVGALQRQVVSAGSICMPLQHGAGMRALRCLELLTWLSPLDTDPSTLAAVRTLPLLLLLQGLLNDLQRLPAHQHGLGCVAGAHGADRGRSG